MLSTVKILISPFMFAVTIFGNVGVISNVYSFNLKNCLQKLVQTLIFDETITLISQDYELLPIFSINNPLVVLSPPFILNAEIETQKNFIILLNGTEDVNSLIQQLTISRIWNTRTSPRGKYFIFLIDAVKVMGILNLFWEKKMFELTVIILNAATSNWEILETNHCRKTIESIQYCGDDTIRYIKKLPNLENCFLEAGLGDVLYELPYLGNAYKGDPGLLLQPLKVIEKKLNLNITYIPIDPEIQKDYFKYGGLVRYKIYESARDVFVACGNRYLHYHEHFDLTSIFLYDYNNWLIAKPDKLSNFKVLAQVFKVQSWIAILCVYVLISLSCWMIALCIDELKCKYILNCFLDTYLITIGFGITKFPSSVSLKIILVFYLFYSINVDYFFFGKLSSILTSPGFERAIESVHEMATAAEITPMTYVGMKHSFLLLNYSSAKILNNRSVPILTAGKTYLFDIMKQHKNISVTSYTAEFTSEYRRYLRILGRDYLLGMEATYGLKKGHPYVVYFNILISWIFEAGFPNKWLKDSFETIYFETAEDDKIVLTLNHLQTANYLLLFGYLVSFLIFSIEFIVNFVNKNIINIK